MRHTYDGRDLIFRTRTVFVVGAGASSEIGLPIGSGLKTNISRRMNIQFADGYRMSSGDSQIWHCVKEHAKGDDSFDSNTSVYQQTAWQIRDAMPQAISIDNYIDAHRENKMIEFLGKLGIVKSILEAEKDSLLYEESIAERKIDLANFTQTWYDAFFQILTEGVGTAEVQQIFNNVSFVVFNYDRCIEQYLYAALKNYYSMSDDQTRNVMTTLRIFRPYGSVGVLPQMQPGEASIGYGSDRINLHNTAIRIKTFTERIDDDAALQELKSMIDEAENVVFLGFAFHIMNMQLLNIGRASTAAKKIYGTAFGISKSGCEVIENDICTMVGLPLEDIRIRLRNDLKCAQLINEYRRSLTA